MKETLRKSDLKSSSLHHELAEEYMESIIQEYLAKDQNLEVLFVPPEEPSGPALKPLQKCPKRSVFLENNSKPRMSVRKTKIETYSSLVRATKKFMNKANEKDEEKVEPKKEWPSDSEEEIKHSGSETLNEVRGNQHLKIQKIESPQLKIRNAQKKQSALLQKVQKAKKAAEEEVHDTDRLPWHPHFNIQTREAKKTKKVDPINEILKVKEASQFIMGISQAQEQNQIMARYKQSVSPKSSNFHFGIQKIKNRTQAREEAQKYSNKIINYIQSKFNRIKNEREEKLKKKEALRSESVMASIRATHKPYCSEEIVS